MSQRNGWLLSSVAVGAAALLFTYVLFSLASSSIGGQEAVMYRLYEQNDTAFGVSSDLINVRTSTVGLVLAGLSVTLFACGMAAALFARPTENTLGVWLRAPLLAAAVPALLINGFLLITWYNNVQAWYRSPVDAYGRPFEPMVFPMLFLFMVGATLIIAGFAAAGGLLAWIALGYERK
jgi:hypothetical protein